MDPADDAGGNRKAKIDTRPPARRYSSAKFPVHLERAYSLLVVKAFDSERRTFAGIATTPELDRQGHRVDPAGVAFRNPLPLLLFHDQKRPIGTASFAPATAEGIAFEASLADVSEPGPLKDRIDEAWQSIKAGLMRGVSIGFRILEDGIKFARDGSAEILKSEVVELSLVTIPANVGASILTVKSFAAAPGRYPPGASGLPIVRVKVTPPMSKSIVEQIKGYENTRAAKAARMIEIMDTAGDKGETLEAAAAEEYDGLKLEVKALEDHITRAREIEKMQIAQATPISNVTTPIAAANLRGGVITVKSLLPPGTSFVRLCQAKIMGKGSHADAIAYAERWMDSTPEVVLELKAAVAAGTTTDATWAGPLAPITPLTREFLELLRPATILGKVPGFKKVPFNVSVASQTGGGSYSWVGQGAPKPVGKLQFGTVTLGITKCAGIIVITLELARNSSPAAEDVIRQDMIAGIAAFLDSEFIDPTKAAVAGVSPGSVTNGVTPITTAGTSPANARTDIQALANAMTIAGISTAGAVVILSETNALALSNALNPLGQPLFPSMAPGGGTILGYQAIPSQAAGTTVALVQPGAVLYADDGGVTIDVSQEASLQMDSAPMAVPDATVVMTSLWQNNLVGLRAERFINWKKARTAAAQYTVATYTA